MSEDLQHGMLVKRHYRQRTPAMALGLTDRVWTVRDLLHYPVPQGI